MSYNRINITNWLTGESENPHQTAVKWSRGAANLNLFLFSDLGVKTTKSENKKGFSTSEKAPMKEQLDLGYIDG